MKTIPLPTELKNASCTEVPTPKYCCNIDLLKKTQEGYSVRFFEIKPVVAFTWKGETFFLFKNPQTKRWLVIERFTCVSVASTEGYRTMYECILATSAQFNRYKDCDMKEVIKRGRYLRSLSLEPLREELYLTILKCLQ